MAHTTRAYISPVADRITLADARERERPGKATRALAEASRILADVEPAFGSPDQDWPHRYTRHSAYQAALAESLAAFVNDGGRA